MCLTAAACADESSDSGISIKRRDHVARAFSPVPVFGMRQCLALAIYPTRPAAGG